MTLSESLVEWAAHMGPDGLPPEVRRSVRRSLLDGLGNAMATARLHAVAAVTTVADGLGGPPEATIIGRPERIGAPSAALANGALVHGLDFDDTHADALIHPTAVILPTVFAVGEEVGSTGTEVITAATVGFEATLRLGSAVRHGFHRRGFHATSVVGVFGAALVASRLYGLSVEQTVAALGIAGSQASGSLEFLATGSTTKQLHPGWASFAGIVAARLARAGASGPSSILEGDAGLYRAYADHTVDPDVVTKDIGNIWEATRVTIKPYPVCQLSHATLDALRDLTSGISLSADDVAAVDVDLPKESVPIVAPARAAEGVAPRTPYEAKFDLRWCLAYLLLEGRLPVEAFEAGQLRRPDVLALAAAVRVRPFDPGVAAAAAPGRVEITTRGGEHFVGQVPSSSGGPDSPLSDDALHAKFHDNCGGRSSESLHLAAELADLGTRADLRGILAAASRLSATIVQERR